MKKNKIMLELFITAIVILILLCSPSIAINEYYIKEEILTQENIILDTVFMENIINSLSEIAVLKNNNSEYLYPKGRFFGTEGEKIARQFLYNEWLTNISDNVVLDPVTNSYDFSHEVIDYGLTIYNKTDNKEIQKIESYPYVTESTDQINHSFTNAKVKLFPLDWLNKHCYSISINNYFLPIAYQLENMLTKINYVNDYENVNLEIEKNTFHLIELTEGFTVEQVDSLINYALDFDSKGLIFVTDNLDNNINVKTSIPTFFISESEGKIIKDQIIENNEINVDIVKDDFGNSDYELIIYNCSNIELENKFGGPDDQELWLMNYNLLYLKIWFNYLENRQKNWDIKIGFIIRDENDETYYMDHTKHNIPGISINGSTGNWIEKQIKNGKKVTADFFIKQRYLESIEAYNVIGTIGEQSNKIIIIEGHLDSMWGQFTIDDGAGIASLFGIAKYFADNYYNEPLDCMLKFIAFTGEEVGCRGSKSYIELHGNELLDSDIICIINLDTFAQKQNFPFTVRYYSGPDGVPESALENKFEDIFQVTDYDQRTNYNYYHDIVNLLSNNKNKNLLEGRCDAGIIYKFLKENGNLPRNALLIDKYDLMNEENMQFFYQRSGEKHIAGDSINLLDKNDLNVSSEVILEIVKYLDSGEGLVNK